MNLEDFEKQLRQQPLRQIPMEWRAEITGAARRIQGPQPSTTNARPTSWWRELLWPCPQAWAGLAAVWILIWALNSGAPETRLIASRQTAPLSRELIMALQEQRRLLSELIAPSPSAEPVRPFIPRPRSELSSGTIAV